MTSQSRVAAKPSHKIRIPDPSPPFFTRVLVTGLLMVILFGISIAVSMYAQDINIQAPENFDECTSAKGSIIQESYPPICTTKKGVRFVKELDEYETQLPPTPTDSIKENRFCGGIAGILCPDGFTCKYDGSYPDASGYCIPNQ